MRIWIASLAAVAVQPLVLVARIAPDYLASPGPIYGAGLLFLAVVVVAAAMVLIVGIPTFLLLRKVKRAGWGTLAAVGFALGALPNALSWPRRIEGYSSGQNWHGKYVRIYVDGDPTSFAWLTYGEGVFFFGLHGLVGALVFYAVWRKLELHSPTAP